MSESHLHLLSPIGFRAAAVYAGIKSSHVPDVAVLACDRPATAAAVFTTNRVHAAPVTIGLKHVANGRLRAVVVNAGNANACTGKTGQRDARSMCRLTASHLHCPATQILPCSTGIIGHLLPMKKIENGITQACAQLGDDADHAHQFAEAILTTDTRPKTAATQFKIGRQTVRLAGCCKGSGMIGPRMSIKGPPHATMLAYLTTDAIITPWRLRTLFSSVCDETFNAVTIDDHTSTNDTAAILASGLSQATIKSAATQRAFVSALREVCKSLAYQIAADGEGATKVVRVSVTGAKDQPAARAIARAIADSPLVKCAMHGNDPNWGRIISAAGYAGVSFDPNHCTLILQGIPVFRLGRPLPFDPKNLSKLLASSEVHLDLRCADGRAATTMWTCDLSRDYIAINADYHT
jgi:glutamate N-acetyltransferase/amino-acid N-acetyltransferase